MGREFYSAVREMFWTETDVVVAQHSAYTKCH